MEYTEKTERVYRYDELRKPMECQFNTSIRAGNSDFHMHSGYEVYLLLNGNIQYFVEQSCYPMTDGNIIIFNNHEIHKATNLMDTPFSRLVLHINPAFVRQFSTNKTNLVSCFQSRKPGQNNMISLSPEQTEAYKTMFYKLARLSESTEYASDILSVSYLIQLLVLINQRFDADAHLTSHTILHRAGPIMNYVDSHLSEALTLDCIAKSLSMDKFYMSHLFKKETENTIFQYILVKRIALAKELLSDGCSVTEACQQSGFNDYSNFIRSFRQITGVTPGQFRKLL